MANHTLWSNQLVQASAYTITQNVELDLLVSAEISNANSPKNSLKIVIKYDSLTPSSGTGRVGAIVEGKDNAGNWSPINYQFSPLVNSVYQATERVLILQPDMDTFNLGIDDIVYPVNKEVARISRQQGRLPDTAWRARIVLLDSDPAGATPFQSVIVSATAETYDV